jgi:hypothetical protein
MDIMNIMKVSSSKFTFSLVAIVALAVAGSTYFVQEAEALPTFTAYHNSTTTTIIWFNHAINGTMKVADWDIQLEDVRGSDQITISSIGNGTKVYSNLHNANATQGPLVITHDAIPTDATYYVNYTQYPNNGFLGNINGTYGDDAGSGVMAQGTDAIAKDFQYATISAAEILKSNDKQIRLTMSEPVNNHNSTTTTEAQNFSLTLTGGRTLSPMVDSVSATNGTSYIVVELQNALLPSDILSIAYTDDGDSHAWLTDAINQDYRLNSTGGINQVTKDIGYGNKVQNFTSYNIVNYLTVGMYGDVTQCYDCTKPVVTNVDVSLDSSIPITITDDNPVQINAGIGDTVSVMVTVDDNMGADSIPFAGLYTNFGETPDNLFYANNYDSLNQMSTSYYEWNVRSDDVAFGNTDAITWDEVTTTINGDRTVTLTYTMTINDVISSSQVWVDIGDKSGNYAKSALPITLEVSGAPAITFASDETQKVVSFFNESILLAIVSQWTATSSDQSTNVEQLSSVLGIDEQLPTWTTSLASWVAEDAIDVADMIVAVEYVINQ